MPHRERTEYTPKFLPFRLLVEENLGSLHKIKVAESFILLIVSAQWRWWPIVLAADVDNCGVVSLFVLWGRAITSRSEKIEPVLKSEQDTSPAKIFHHSHLQTTLTGVRQDDEVGKKYIGLSQGPDPGKNTTLDSLPGDCKINRGPQALNINAYYFRPAFNFLVVEIFEFDFVINYF